MQVSELGSFPAVISQPMFRIPTTFQIHRHGEPRWPISPTRNATSRRISRTRASWSISISVASWGHRLSSIRTRITVRERARTLLPITHRISRKRIGNSRGSRFIRRELSTVCLCSFFMSNLMSLLAANRLMGFSTRVMNHGYGLYLTSILDRYKYWA